MSTPSDQAPQSRFFWTKVTTSVLCAILFWQLSVVVADIAYDPEPLMKPAYLIGGVERPMVAIADVRRTWPTAGPRLKRDRVKTFMTNIKDTPGTAPILASLGGPEVEEDLDLPTRLSMADPAKGKRVANKCKSCHTFEKGGINKDGPNLWGVIGSPTARIEGYDYSDAMTNFGGEWDYETLFAYLEDSRAFVAGTEMNFKLPKAKDRANLLAFLQTQADAPVSFPPVPEPTESP